MLACLAPVCSTKAHDNEVVAQEGRTTAEPSKHDNSFFTCQFKQMASKLSGGSISKYCKTACGKAAKDNDNLAGHPGASEMQSPQFSLKGFQMNEHMSPRPDSQEYPFDTARASPKALRSLQKKFAESTPATEGEARPDLGAAAYKVYSREWVAQVEPGVYITFFTAPDGFNDLKRIKFSRQLFSKQRAEVWWKENCPRVKTLYNVRPPSSTTTDEDCDGVDRTPEKYLTDFLPEMDTRPREHVGTSIAELLRFPSGFATPDSKSPCSSYIGGDYLVTRRKSSADANLKEDDKLNDSVTSEEISNSWVEQDEPGVYLTMITVPGVGKQLKRVRFSREKFSEREAAAWWEHNRQRIYAQYIFTNTKLQGK